MKKTIFYTLLLILILIENSSYKIFAQWVAQFNPSSINLQDVTFINRNTGWACGDGSQIIKTTNGGVNWLLQNSGVTSKILTGIHAVDSQIVYCVGYFQTILKTTNGGDNWAIIRNGTWGSDPSLFGLYFLNRTAGWLLRNEYVLRTTDGGGTFDSTHINFSYLRDIYFKDAQTGVLCTDGAGIFKSTDGGINWNQIIIPQTTTESPNFYKESFIGNVGFVVGEGTNVPGLGPLTWRTTNFGSNWDTISRVSYPYTHSNYCVFFSSLNTGWCGGSYGHIFKTTNGGYNWHEQVVPSNYFRISMSFYNDSIGWAVGGFGQILFTTNRGTYVEIKKISETIPKEFKLYQNYPNPFNSKTVIKYQISKSSNVKIIIFNTLGQEIEILVNEYQRDGIYTVNWDAVNYPSGIYFYRILTNSQSSTHKAVLIK